jgi:hypothetical protein
MKEDLLVTLDDSLVCNADILVGSVVNFPGMGDGELWKDEAAVPTRVPCFELPPHITLYKVS